MVNASIRAGRGAWHTLLDIIRPFRSGGPHCRRRARRRKSAHERAPRRRVNVITDGTLRYVHGAAQLRNPFPSVGGGGWEGRLPRAESNLHRVERRGAATDE